jgi:hypothetical protein
LSPQADTAIARVIVVDGEVAGSSWGSPDEREVTYWIGRSYWGKGIATSARDAVGSDPKPAALECGPVHVFGRREGSHVCGNRIRPLLEQHRQILVPHLPQRALHRVNPPRSGRIAATAPCLV